MEKQNPVFLVFSHPSTAENKLKAWRQVLLRPQPPGSAGGGFLLDPKFQSLRNCYSRNMMAIMAKDKHKLAFQKVLSG